MVKPLVIDEQWMNRIVGSVNGLEYGSVQIIVHDGRIVQIERTDRKRFEQQTPAAPPEQPISKGRPKIRTCNS